MSDGSSMLERLRDQRAPNLMLGYLVYVITAGAAVAGGAWGAATFMGNRDTQIFNLEYRVGLIENAKKTDAEVQRSYQEGVVGRLDKIRSLIVCLQIQAANKSARCPDNP